MRESRDEELLKYVWIEWRRLTGAKTRQNFTDMMEIVNEIARLNSKYFAFHILCLPI